MKMREVEIASLGQFTDEISDLAASHAAHLHLRLWFRGVPDAKFELTPSVYRGNPHTDLATDERHAFRDFRLWSAGLIAPNTSLVDLYFQQQHHGLPTRLLDWTTNALIAIYFAVEQFPNEAAAVYAMDAYGFKPKKFKSSDGIIHEAGGFAVAGGGSNTLLSTALSEIVDWRSDVEQPNFIFPVRPAFTDIRMQIQRGCFTYHPPNVRVLSHKENNSLNKFWLKPEAKRKLKNQLKHLGIDHFSVYGDLDSLAKTTKENFSLGL